MRAVAELIYQARAGDGARYKARTTKVRISEHRGTLLFPYTRDTWQGKPTIPNRLGPLAEVALKATYRQRITVLWPEERHRWNEYTTRWELLEDGRTDRPRPLPAKGTARRRKPPEYTRQRRTHVEVRNVARGAIELKFFMTGSKIGSKLVARLTLEKAHGQAVPGDQLLRWVRRNPLRTVDDVMTFIRDTPGKDELEGDLYVFVKQPLLPDAPVEAVGPWVPLIENLSSLRGFQVWVTSPDPTDLVTKLPRRLGALRAAPRRADPLPPAPKRGLGKLATRARRGADWVLWRVDPDSRPLTVLDNPRRDDSAERDHDG